MAGRLISTAVLGVASACSPTFDWRDVRLADDLVALFPCRPKVLSRQLEIAGGAETMELSSCNTGGLTFAVGRIAAADQRRVAPIQQALRDALFANLSTAPEAAAATKGLAAASSVAAQSAARPISVRGTGPDGELIFVRSRFFNRGSTIYQATVVGQDEKAETSEFFFSSLGSRF